MAHSRHACSLSLCLPGPRGRLCTHKGSPFQRDSSPVGVIVLEGLSMPVGDMIFVVRFLFTTPCGIIEPHAWYRRVKSGREGIDLRNRIVSAGTQADDRIVVTECRFFPLTGEGKAAA